MRACRNPYLVSVFRGESCYDCTKKRVGILDVMRPLYQNIFDRFGQLGGRSNGIVIGLFIDASEPMIYFNIPVLAKKPIQILPPRVYPSGIMRPVTEEFGEFDYPTHGLLSVPTIGPGSTFRLLDYWYNTHGSCPKFVVYFDIDGIFSVSNEWQYKFGAGYVIDKLTRRAKKSNVYTAAMDELTNLRANLELIQNIENRRRMEEFNTSRNENQTKRARKDLNKRQKCDKTVAPEESTDKRTLETCSSLKVTTKLLRSVLLM